MTSETRTVPLGDRSYDIFFDNNVYQAVPDWIRNFRPGKSVYVVTDKNVASIYGDDIRRRLVDAPEKLLTLPPGEEHKNLSAVSRIYAFLAEANADRDSILVAFGGGVVGDLVGFAAATFLRGISFIQVPTTLLAMLDSSVGGKTGFNLPEGKNLVGAFHQPAAVFIDDSFLVTLDDQSLRSGLAEGIKSALAGDARLWELFVAKGSRWKTFSNDDWREVVRRSVSFKISVIERDERELYWRKILNLGHTIGHALEQAGGYGRLLHGEAVAAGLAWEAVLGRRLGVTPESVVDGVMGLLLDMGYELDVAEIPLDSIEAAVGMDKKRVVSELDLPLITGPGECEIRRFPLEKIRKELLEVREEIRDRTSEKAIDMMELYVGQPEETVRSLERHVAVNPRDNTAIRLLADAYRKTGNLAAAWGAIQEALGRNPSDPSILQMAAELEKESPMGVSVEEAAQAALPFENMLVVGEDAYQIQAADSDVSQHEKGTVSEAGVSAPEASVDADSAQGELSIAEDAEPEIETPGEPDESESTREARTEKAAVDEPFSPKAVGTVTLADLYWEQGDRVTARKIVSQILEKDPDNARAREWMSQYGEEDSVESALRAFLVSTAKEFGHDISRYN